MKVNRIRDPEWLKAVSEMPCVLTGRPQTQAAHIRYCHGGGMGLKPSDDRVVPLNHVLHAKQHSMGEVRFWRENISDGLLMSALIAYAEKLYRNRGAL